MRAAVAVSQDYDNPLSCLQLTDVPKPDPRDGWSLVRVVASTLNPHDLWTLRGVGHPAERIPIVLGCDAAGYTDDGRAVIVHPVMGNANRGFGDMTLDPQRALLSETINGAFAEFVLVPNENIIPKPDFLTFEEAASVLVAWGTAYRMLFTRAGLKPGDRVLVQGVTGGVASAAIRLARAAGATVYATARSETSFAFGLEHGAHEVFLSGSRLPERVDIVVDSVGEATWSHSLKSLRPGGIVVTCGATSGPNANADLNRIFYQQLSVVGSTGSTLSEMTSLLRFLETEEIHPPVAASYDLENIHGAFLALMNETHAGKIAITVSPASI